MIKSRQQCLKCLLRGIWRVLMHMQSFVGVFEGRQPVYHDDSVMLLLRMMYNKKRSTIWYSSVIRLGLEPKTPTLKVLCSTS